MLSDEQALQLVVDSISSLRRTGMIEAEVQVAGDTVLLGYGSIFDSIAFVTFITDVEDRLNQKTGQDLYLVLTDIHEFNPESGYLSADMLARHIAYLAHSGDKSS